MLGDDIPPLFHPLLRDLSYDLRCLARRSRIGDEALVAWKEGEIQLSNWIFHIGISTQFKFKPFLRYVVIQAGGQVCEGAQRRSSHTQSMNRWVAGLCRRTNHFSEERLHNILSCKATLQKEHTNVISPSCSTHVDDSESDIELFVSEMRKFPNMMGLWRTKPPPHEIRHWTDGEFAIYFQTETCTLHQFWCLCCFYYHSPPLISPAICLGRTDI